MTSSAETRPAIGPSLWQRLRKAGWLGWLCLIFALGLTAPILAVAINIFLPGQGTFAHLAETVLADYALNSIGLALGVGFGVFVIGTACGWLVTMCDFPGRRIFEWALVLPLAVPAYVLAYVYADLLQFAGPIQTSLRGLTGWAHGDYWFPEIRSLGGAIALLTLVLYPYVYLLSRAAFLEQSVCALDISRTLGCTAWSSFFRVALPLARPALAAGVALALMEAVADFGVVSYFDLPAFTTGIYRAWFSFGDHVAAAQLSTLLLACVFAILLLERSLRGHSRYHQSSGRYRPIARYRLRGWRGAVTAAIVALPLFLGFLLPAAHLLRLSLAGGDAQFGSRYLELAWNSLSLALLAAAGALGAALLFALALRLRPSGPIRFAARIAGLGYAVPGTIIAIGVLLPVTAFDHWIDRLAQSVLGLSTGLLFTGGIAALIFAYVVRFLASALHTVEAGFAKVTPSIDGAARSLGRGPLAMLVSVHMKLIWPSLLTAALLVFVDVMKELPATLIMRPFNFDTLAVQAYNLARDERLTEAATPALTIVAVGLVPLILLTRQIARGRPGQAEIGVKG